MRSMRSLVVLAAIASQLLGTPYAKTCGSNDKTCASSEADAADPASTLLAMNHKTREEIMAIEEETTDLKPAKNQLLVTIVKATGLPTETAADFVVPNRPYVFCTLNAKSPPIKSPVSSESSNPEWGYTDVLAGWDASQDFNCEIFDELAVNDDTPVSFGKATITGSEITNGMEKDFALEGGEGRLHLKFALEPIIMYFDGATPTALPKKVGDAPEILFVSLSKERSDIQVHPCPPPQDMLKCATIAKGATAQGIFSRKSKMGDGRWAEDAGIMHWRLQDNPMSLFPGSVYGVAEKSLSIRQTNLVSVVDEEGNEKNSIEKNNELTSSDNAAIRAARHQMVTLEQMQGEVFKSLFYGGFDQAQLGTAVKLLKARQNPLGDAGTAKQQAQGLADELYAYQANGFKPEVDGTPNPDDVVATGASCLHFTFGTLHDGGFTFPLDVQQMVFRGVTQFAPLGKFYVAPYIQSVHYSEEHDAFEFSLVAMSKALIEDPRLLGPKPVFYQGPPFVPPPHGDFDFRVQIGKKNPHFAWLYNEVRNLPADYGYFWNDEDCKTEEQRAKIKHLVSTFDIHAAMAQGAKMAKPIIGYTVAALACGKNYLRGAGTHSHAFGFFEVCPWQHFLMEVPNEYQWAALTYDWNNMDILADWDGKQNAQA